MVRLLYAILATLLTAAVMLAAPPKAPPVAVPPKAPPVTINDSGVIVHPAAPVVAEPRPFWSTATMPGTVAPVVPAQSTSLVGSTRTGRTIIGAVRAGRYGGTANCLTG